IDTSSAICTPRTPGTPGRPLRWTPAGRAARVRLILIDPDIDADAIAAHTSRHTATTETKRRRSIDRGKEMHSRPLAPNDISEQRNLRRISLSIATDERGHVEMAPKASKAAWDQTRPPIEIDARAYNLPRCPNDAGWTFQALDALNEGTLLLVR